MSNNMTDSPPRHSSRDYNRDDVDSRRDRDRHGERSREDKSHRHDHHHSNDLDNYHRRDRDRNYDDRESGKLGRDHRRGGIKREENYGRKGDRGDKKDHRSKSKKDKKDRKTKISAQDTIIKDTDHLIELTKEQIEAKLMRADPEKIEHASFLLKYSPPFHICLNLSKTNFYTSEQRTALQNEARAKAKAILDAQKGDGDGESDNDDGFQWTSTPLSTKPNPKKPSQPPSQFELDAMREAVRKKPNYFTTELLRTVGGGSIFQGSNTLSYNQIPGQGATNQLPVNFTNLDQPLEVKTFDMDALQSKQKQESIPLSKLLADPSKLAQFQLHTGSHVGSVIGGANMYNEPDDAVIPREFDPPANVKFVRQWYVTLKDISPSLYTNIDNIGPIWYNPMTRKLDWDGEIGGEVKKEEGGQNGPQNSQSDLKTGIKSESPDGKPTPYSVDISSMIGVSRVEEKKGIVVTLSTKSCYKTGTLEINDLILTSNPTNFPKPTIILNPELIKLMEGNETLGEQVEKVKIYLQDKIDTIWSQIILSNNSLSPTHCMFQFRLRPATITVTPTPGNPSTTATMNIPTPYIFIPTPSALLTPFSNPECYFRELAAHSATGFVKNPVPTNRFVEIQNQDVVLMGNSYYELIFHSSLVPRITKTLMND